MNFSICCFQDYLNEFSLIDLTAIINQETYSISTSSPVIRSLSVFIGFSLESEGGIYFFDSSFNGVALIGSFYSGIVFKDAFFPVLNSEFEVTTVEGNYAQEEFLIPI